MKAAGFAPFRQAIKVRCLTVCQRMKCYGCPFEPWSARLRQIRMFTARRARIAAARRTAARAAAQ